MPLSTNYALARIRYIISPTPVTELGIGSPGLKGASQPINAFVNAVLIATIWFCSGTIAGWLVGVGPLTSGGAYLLLSLTCILLFNLTSRGQRVFETLFSARPDVPEPGCYETGLFVFLAAFPVISLSVGLIVSVVRLVAQLPLLNTV